MTESRGYAICKKYDKDDQVNKRFSGNFHLLALYL